MATTNNIVIIGGSYAGLSTAHYLLKHVLPILPTEKAFKIILVSSAGQVLCRPACPRAMISDDFFQQDKLFVSIARVFEQYPMKDFAFIQGTATNLEVEDRLITLTNRAGNVEKLDFLSVVIATGAKTHSPLLGLTTDEQHLRNAWMEFRQALPRARRIVVAGGGPSAIETAGELGEHLNGRAGWFASKLEKPKVHITVVSGASKILPQLRDSIAKTAEDYLAQVGVEVLKGSRVEKVTPDSAGTTNVSSPCQVTLADGRILDADLYIPAYGTVPNTQFMPKSLLEADGRVKTNPKTFRVDEAGPGVYAVGDVSAAARPAVHLVLNAIPVVAANIKRDLLSQYGGAENTASADREHIEDTTETQLVPIGQTKGVGAFKGYRMLSLFVWLIKGRDYWLWTTGNLWSGKQWNKEA